MPEGQGRRVRKGVFIRTGLRGLPACWRVVYVPCAVCMRAVLVQG